MNIESKINKITDIIMNEYDDSDFEISPSEIEREIYQASESYAGVFIFEKGGFLSEKEREDNISFIRFKFDVSEKEISKMSDIELVAHYIKGNVINLLEENELFIIN